MTEPLAIPVRVLAADLPLPAYARDGDAGLDLHAAVDVALAPGARMLVPTGLALAIPPGFAGFVLPRSGLALRHGVTLLNTPGLIDAGYRGELQVLLVNLGDTLVKLTRGDRIAQLVIQPVERARSLPLPSSHPVLAARAASAPPAPDRLAGRFPNVAAQPVGGAGAAPGARA